MDNVLTQKLPSHDISNKLASSRNEANTAIIALNKALHSSNIGEQCEAIVRLGPIISSHPFPTIVNATFHKLSDTYLSGSNTLRIAILQVFDQWSEHFNKISKTDDFYRKIFSVTNSTDPVARAITLRVLGHISCIIPERKNAHHCIHRSFDSNYKEEVIAAIFAAKCFCEHSQTFCAGVCSRLIEMIQEISTPIEIKLKLLAVFEHMGHDPETAIQVKNFCVNMLHNYPEKEFTTTILNTLTKLSLKCTLLVVDNLAVLSNIALQDARKSIQLISCKNLQLIAQKSPHLWSKESISNVLKLAEHTPHCIIRAEALLVLYKLVQSDLMGAIFDGLSTFERCTTLAFHKDVRVCVSACNVIVGIISRKYEEGTSTSASLQNLVDQADARVIPLFGIVFVGEDSSEFLTSSLISLAQKLSLVNDLFAHRLSEVVSNTLMRLEAPSDRSETLYRILTAILRSCSLNLMRAAPHLITQLENTSSPGYIFSITQLLMLIHHSDLHMPARFSFRSEVIPVIILVLNNLEDQNKFWLIYRIAKLALSLSFHELAFPLLRTLSNLPTSEQYRVLFQSLLTLTQAETLLLVASSSVEDADSMDVSDTVPLCSFDPSLILNVVKLYSDGILHLQACRTLPNKEFWEYLLQLRSDLIAALHQILLACNHGRLMPRSSNNSQPDRLGFIFGKCVEKITSCLDLLKECRYRSFNADATTIAYFNVVESTCNTLSLVIHNIILKQECDFDLVSDKLKRMPNLKSLKPYINLCLMAINELTKSSHLRVDPVSHQQIDFIRKFSFSLLVIPFSYPLYLFHCKHKTEIQLSFTNLPEKPQETINLSFDTSLAFTIEGIISGKQTARTFQTITGVSVKAHVRPDRNSQQPPLLRSSLHQTLIKQADMQQDNFNVSFLIQFTQPGCYFLDISVHLVDEEGTLWLATQLEPKPPQFRVQYGNEDYS